MAVPVSFLDGEVTLAAAPPWGETSDALDTSIRFNGSRDDHVVIATDPLRSGRTARTFRLPPMPKRWLGASWPTPPREHRGRAGAHRRYRRAADGRGCGGGRLDSYCWAMLILDQADRWRMRLYLIDYPGGSALGLTIAVIAAPETDFERVLEETTPIVESLEIHPG